MIIENVFRDSLRRITNIRPHFQRYTSAQHISELSFDHMQIKDSVS